MSDLKQCTELTANVSFSFVNPLTKRAVKIKQGEILWVMSCSTSAERKQGAVMIGRLNMPNGTGWIFPEHNIFGLFSLVQQ